MKVLILHKWLIMGGIERILINYLRLLQNETSLSIDLLIAFDTPNNAFSDSIPAENNVYYLFDKAHYVKQQSLSQHKNKNIISKLKQKWHRYKEKQYCRKALNKHIANYDIIINFSNHFDPYIDFKDIHKPIIRWQHLALKDETHKDCIKEVSYLRKYSKVVSICQEMIEDLAKKTNIASSKLTYIYNPLNFAHIHHLAEQDKIDLNPPYLIQVARLDKIKRHIDLIEIYASLVEKGIPHNLYILGNGDEYDKLKEKIADLQLENRCFLLGEIANPYPYIKNADLFLHTSEREGLPTVLLESAILETPIVAMNCPTGVKEILNNGKCGELIPLGNKAAFIDKTYILINTLSLQEKYRQEMRENLRNFSEEKTKSDFLALINNSMNENQ